MNKFLKQKEHFFDLLQYIHVIKKTWALTEVRTVLENISSSTNTVETFLIMLYTER